MDGKVIAYLHKVLFYVILSTAMKRKLQNRYSENIERDPAQQNLLDQKFLCPLDGVNYGDQPHQHFHR